MALDLEELEKTEVLLKPKTMKSKNLMPWDRMTDSKTNKPKNKKNSDENLSNLNNSKKVTTLVHDIKDIKIKEKKISSKSTQELPLKTDDLNNLDNLNNQNLFFSLSGLGREILLYIGGICINKGDLTTHPISYQEIANNISINKKGIPTTEVVRKTISRLRKSGFLNRVDSKRGPNARIIFNIDQYVFKEILLEQKNQILNESVEIPAKLKNIEVPLDASNDQDQQNIFELPPEWMQVSFFGLNESIKLGINQLTNIAKSGKLTPEEVERSFEEFSHDINNGLVKAKNGPLRMLMGILLKGQKYHSNDESFKPEMDRILEENLKRRLKRQHELLALQNEVKDAEFLNWISNLSESKKQDILEGMNIFRLESLAAKQKNIHLKAFWSENIYSNETMNPKIETNGHPVV